MRGKLPVYLRITIDAARIESSTYRECEPERWNAQAGRANGIKEEIKNLNAYLDSFQAKVYEVHRSLIDKPITAANIKQILRGTTEKPRMILEVFQHHNDQVAQLVDKIF